MLGFLVWMGGLRVPLAWLCTSRDHRHIYLYVCVCVYAEVVHSPNICPHVTGGMGVLRHPLCCTPPPRSHASPQLPCGDQGESVF